jgi:hypothetical protein
MCAANVSALSAIGAASAAPAASFLVLFLSKDSGGL